MQTDFKDFVSKLFSKFPLSQKLQTPLSDPFYYDEYGTIKSYEHLQSLMEKQIESAEKIVTNTRKIYLTDIPCTEDHKRLNYLELRIAELTQDIIEKDYHHISQHIQVSKTVVALYKILRSYLESIPITQEDRNALKLLIKHSPMLYSLDKRLDGIADHFVSDTEERK